MQHITILGDGSWGTACATILAHNRINVTLWCYNEHVARDISEQQENTSYLPGIPLDTQYIYPTTSHQEALRNARYVCFAIPVKHMRSVLYACQPHMRPEHVWISLSKGIEQKTGLLPTQIVQDIAPYHMTTGVIAGPSFAREVAQRKPTGLVCAMNSRSNAESIMRSFSTEFTFTSYHDDILGAQVAGALKNVYAIASGMLNALVASHNSTALLTTHALHEIHNIAQHLGGRSETTYSLAGIGDLMLTCHSSQSRNHTVGYEIGSGKQLEEFITSVNFIPEGINTIASAYSIVSEACIRAPIIYTMYDIIYNNKPAHTLIDMLHDATTTM